MTATVQTTPVRRPEPGREGGRRRRKRPPLRKILTYLMLSVIALIFLMPFLYLLSAALKPMTQQVFSNPPDLIPKPPVLDSFKSAWTSVPFPRYLLNSLVYVAIGVPLTVIVTALTAYPLAVMRFRGRQTVFFMLLSAMFLPSELLLIPLYLVVKQLGMTNTYQGVILPGLVSAFAAIFLLRQAFAGVPTELSDAARIDGCGEWRIFWNVMLPVVRPTLAIAAILGFINIWNAFVWPLVVLSDDAKYPIALGVAYLSGISGGDVRSLSAGTVLSLIPIVIFFLFLQKQVMEGAKGSVKG